MDMKNKNTTGQAELLEGTEIQTEALTDVITVAGKCLVNANVNNNINIV